MQQQVVNQFLATVHPSNKERVNFDKNLAWIFRKNIWHVFFLLAIVDVERVKTILKIGGTEHILSNILEIIEDAVSMYIHKIITF